MLWRCLVLCLSSPVEAPGLFAFRALGMLRVVIRGLGVEKGGQDCILHPLEVPSIVLYCPPVVAGESSNSLFSEFASPTDRVFHSLLFPDELVDGPRAVPKHFAT